MIWPFKKTETRAESRDPFLGQFLANRWQGKADIERASGHAVAHRCISVIAENLASVPLKLYRKTENGGREAASDHSLYSVLQDNASLSLTAFECREWLVASVLMWGNGYAKIERNGRGQVIGLFPMAANNVAVERLTNGRLRYKFGNETLLQDEVLHIRNRTKDGITCLSPLAIASATVALALAQSDQAGAAAENAFRPAGALVFPEKLSGTSSASVLTAFKDKFVGALKAGEVMVLDGGVKFETFQFSAKDAEFLESRKLSNLDICRIFGVPPTVAGILDHGTYSNVEMESRALVTRCLAPMAKRVEQAMNSALLTPESRKTLFIEHDLAGLLRGDLTTRYAAYRTGREGGWLSANEIRRFENMSEISDGDTYLQPLNMAPLGANDNSKLDIAA